MVLSSRQFDEFIREQMPHAHDWDCLGVVDGRVQYECRDPSCRERDSEPEEA